MIENVLVKPTIQPASYGAGTVNGAAVENVNPGRPYDGFNKCIVMLHAGLSSAGSTVNVKLQESDNGSTWSDIPGAAFSQVTPANDETVYTMQLSLVGRKRYFRAVGTVGTAASVFGVTLLLLDSSYRPITQDNAPVLVANAGA
jgi:hypothetical protein